MPRFNIHARLRLSDEEARQAAIEKLRNDALFGSAALGVGRPGIMAIATEIKASTETSAVSSVRARLVKVLPSTPILSVEVQPLAPET